MIRASKVMRHASKLLTNGLKFDEETRSALGSSANGFNREN